MKVLAPGKLILSGEHAVVYGKPALAMAIDRYVMATASPHRLPFVSFVLSDLAHESRLSFSALRNIKDRIKRKYDRFMRGEFKISEVLQKPVELAHFVLTLFFEALNIKLNQGIKIYVQSDIPIGCGMGSSAATILSISHAIARHLSIDLPQETSFRLALEAENMQHGYSSGLDLRVSLQGGCLYVNGDAVQTRLIPQIKFYLVNTGTPETSTGESVATVASRFKSSLIWSEFESVTQAMDQALQLNQIQKAQEMIGENHRLLNCIGVVPERVKQFIDEIELGSGVAKISGAGATRGHQAGAVLVMTHDESHLKKICDKYQYSIISVSGAGRGVHVV